MGSCLGMALFHLPSEKGIFIFNFSRRLIHTISIHLSIIHTISPNPTSLLLYISHDPPKRACYKKKATKSTEPIPESPNSRFLFFWGGEEGGGIALLGRTFKRVYIHCCI